MKDWLLKAIDGITLGWTWNFKWTGFTNDKLDQRKNSGLDCSRSDKKHLQAKDGSKNNSKGD